MLQLQKFDLTLTYKKGKHLYLADTLSRAPRCNACPQKAERPEFEVMMTVQLISPRRLEELRQYTAEDTVLQKLTCFIQQGWPRRPCSVPTEVRPFFSFRDELTVEHPGVESTKRRARESVFWPSLNEDIQSVIMACAVCNSLRPHQQKEPLKLHTVPDLPWSLVATNMFEWKTHHYLVLVDSYSGWFEIDRLSSLSSLTVINNPVYQPGLP